NGTATIRIQTPLEGDPVYGSMYTMLRADFTASEAPPSGQIHKSPGGTAAASISSTRILPHWDSGIGIVPFEKGRSTWCLIVDTLGTLVKPRVGVHCRVTMHLGFVLTG
ncbi:MAG TPA: hypothetical protein PLG27_03740, partial [Candidatus Latescibacteria bacterium]|nr:hypothetical protein [Candidatus Latescibacterota bacterium]